MEHLQTFEKFSQKEVILEKQKWEDVEKRAIALYKKAGKDLTKMKDWKYKVAATIELDITEPNKLAAKSKKEENTWQKTSKLGRYDAANNTSGIAKITKDELNKIYGDKLQESTNESIEYYNYIDLD